MGFFHGCFITLSCLISFFHQLLLKHQTEENRLTSTMMCRISEVPTDLDTDVLDVDWQGILTWSYILPIYLYSDILSSAVTSENAMRSGHCLMQCRITIYFREPPRQHNIYNSCRHGYVQFVKPRFVGGGNKSAFKKFNQLWDVTSITGHFWALEPQQTERKWMQ